MPGIDMRKYGPGQWQYEPAKRRGERMNAATAGPSIHPAAEYEPVDQEGKVDRPAEGQDEEDNVGRIENRRLKPGEKGFAGIGVGIPKWQMPAPQAPRGERPPGQKLLAQISRGRAIQPIRRQKEDKGGTGQEQESHRPAAPSVPIQGVRRGVHPQEG